MTWRNLLCEQPNAKAERCAIACPLQRLVQVSRSAADVVFVTLILSRKSQLLVEVISPFGVVSLLNPILFLSGRLCLEFFRLPTASHHYPPATLPYIVALPLRVASPGFLNNGLKGTEVAERVSAVRGKGYRYDTPGMPGKGPDLFAAGHIP